MTNIEQYAHDYRDMKISEGKLKQMLTDCVESELGIRSTERQAVIKELERTLTVLKLPTGKINP